MSDDITKLSDFLDKKKKESLKKGKKKSSDTEEDSSNVTINVSGDWFSGDRNQIANISRGADGREHRDDSAERQGRKAISERKANDVVDIKHMTPKEYRNHKAGFWDGIETRDGTQNWEPYEWPQASHFNNAPERRDSDRRIEKKLIKKNKRQQSRRKIDKVSERNEAVLYYSGLGIGYGILFTAFSAVIINLMGT